MSQSRQLAAIMFTDMVGYTALMDEDEDKAIDLLSKNRLVQGPLIEKYHGRWLKEMGDGVLASFASVTDAVLCAAAIQKTCEDQPDLNLRIGIHQGEVIFEGDDVFGGDVNVASRLEALASAGQVLVSESVHLNLENKKNIRSTYQRQVQLKGVKHPIKIYSVEVDGMEPAIIPESYEPIQAVSKSLGNYKKLGLVFLSVILISVFAFVFFSSQDKEQIDSLQAAATDKSIAVLPFKNDSPDSTNQYFCDGMMDEILNHLQRIKQLGVKSRTAVEPYRSSVLSFAAIANELDVAYLLEGAVRKYGDRFRVTTQLIDVASGNHLWSNTYDGEFSDTIFVVQGNIAKKVASSLSAVITPKERESIDRIPTSNIEAYDLCIRAKHERLLYYQSWDPQHLERSRNLLAEALRLDPNYALAILDKGATHAAERNYDSAFVYVDKAMRLDPSLPAAYGLMGDLYYFTEQFDLAIDHYHKALDLTGKSWYHIALGRVYSANGEFPRALPHLEKALERDSDDHSSLYINIAACYLNLGHYEKVIEYSFKANKSRWCSGFEMIILAYEAQGKYERARQIADSTLTCQEALCKQHCLKLSYQEALLSKDFAKAEEYFSQWKELGHTNPTAIERMHFERGYVLYHLGREEEANRIVKEQIEVLKSELPDESRYTYLNLSRILAFKGEKKAALDYLEKYAKKGFTFGEHDYITIDPLFENLRQDPKFQEIVRKAQEEKVVLRSLVEKMEERGEINL